MKKLALLLLFCFLSVGLYASVENPAVARVASKLTGIVDMKVKPGEHVKKGQLLFNVQTDFSQTIKNKCKNNVWYYQRVYDRIKKLYKNRSKSLEALQEAQYKLDSAREDLRSQELLINERSHYYAPFDGVVTKINNFSGSCANTGTAAGDDNAVIEITRKSDYQKSKYANKSIVAQVSPMIDGIVEMEVVMKQHVKKGQLLFKIDTAENLITQAKQKAILKYYKALYDRENYLYGKNTESLTSLQLAQLNYENASEDLKSTNIMINKRSAYYAPFDGVVSNIVHYSGSAAFSGSKVIEVTES